MSRDFLFFFGTGRPMSSLPRKINHLGNLVFLIILALVIHGSKSLVHRKYQINTDFTCSLLIMDPANDFPLFVSIVSSPTVSIGLYPSPQVHLFPSLFFGLEAFLST